MTVGAVVLACKDQTPRSADRIPDHSVLELGRFHPFRAKVVDKQVLSIPNIKTKKTNFLVLLVLEQEGGTRLSVSEKAESEGSLRTLSEVVRSLEVGRTYTFPAALGSTSPPP